MHLKSIVGGRSLRNRSGGVRRWNGADLHAIRVTGTARKATVSIENRPMPQYDALISTKAALFRQKFLQASSPLRIVGAHDGLGAQLIERHGLDGVWASGLEISASHGVPDANILTMTQYLERAQEMHTASGLPVLCDVDTGYGNSSNVHYLVKQYQASGIAGIVIEDKLFPKVNSFVPGRQELASVPEFCGKLAAAHDARQTEDFLVIARVEALIAGWGMEEALRRAAAYVQAGADGILIHSKAKTGDEIRAFLRAWNKRAPIVLVPTTYPDLTYDEMGTLGVNLVIYANQCLRASISAMHRVLETIQREKSTVAIEREIATVKEIFELQGMMAMKEHEKRYLRTSKTVHAIVPAAGTPKHEGKMAELLRDRPVAMLDVGGKPLIDRVVESLNLAGVQDVTVLTGYKGEMIHLASGDVRRVPDYERGGILHSVAVAADKFADSVLIQYGDVLVSHENLRSFIECEDPIVILTSPLLREGRYRHKQFEVVSLARPNASLRTLERHPRNTAASIGTDVPQEAAQAEFVGLVLLNPQGVCQWNEAMETLSDEERRTFSLAAFLQRLIDRGAEIATFEARTGWSEIHSVEDYEQVQSLLQSA